MTETGGTIPDKPDPTALILSLKTGTCWCGKGIGNPMLKKHSKACLKAQEYIEKVNYDE